MKWVYLLLIAVMITPALASSTVSTTNQIMQFDGYIKEGSEKNLVDTCFNGFEDRNCNSSSSCTVDIVAPNGSMLFTSQPMTTYGNNYTYNITIPSTAEAGEYTKKTTCTEGAKEFNAYSTFIINGTGSNNTMMLPFMIVSLFIIFLLVIFTIWSYIKQSGLKYGFLLLTSLAITATTYFTWRFLIGTGFEGILYAVYWSSLILFFLLFLLTLWEVTMGLLLYFSGKKKKHYNDNL